MATSPRSPEPDRHALLVTVGGAVQGVGFRPFVHGLALELGLAGEVRNTSAGVEIEVEGAAADLDAFVARLVDDAPPLALIDELETRPGEPAGRTAFTIAKSTAGARVDTLVTADAATCPACLSELLDPQDRRFRYPFTNCTDCGPRFTITKAVPYDRPNTTMAGFVMCPDCLREYRDPANRRFHAQPNACPVCGPRLRFLTAGGESGLEADAALRRAVALVEGGGILAVKGLGGYHLACDAADEDAVAALRRRKQRDERPFAIMAADVAVVRRFCRVSPAEEDLLTSPRRPVVILEQEGERLAAGVAPGVETYGFFLPYTPLHHLLLHDVGRPLVMTSGNVSDEPIAYRDDDAVGRLSPLCDGFLTHDRPIHIRTDDSVARVFRGAPYLLRRARGYVPLPVRFVGADRPLLAVGGHLKNTFCLTRGPRAFVSHHIGDLENLETLRSLRDGIDHFRGLFALTPEVVVHDLHPDYLSTRLAREYAAQEGLPLMGVQHHEAHIGSVLADAGYDGPVVGVAFDGAGFGPDGTIWGGEFFVGPADRLQRAAHLELLPLPGGDRAVREPWRLALMLLRLAAGGGDRSAPEAAETVSRLFDGLPDGVALSDRPWRLVLQMAESGLNTPMTSSAGRLFDGIAALLGLRQEVSYEGQAAILLEAAARRARGAAGPSPSDDPPWGAAARPTRRPGGAAADPLILPVRPFVDGVLSDLAAGLPETTIAARFHGALARETAAMAVALADAHGLDTVALGGGVFQNLLLLELVVARLEAAGLRVLVHRSVPTNDGGLCLGQAQVAALRLRS